MISAVGGCGARADGPTTNSRAYGSATLPTSPSYSSSEPSSPSPLPPPPTLGEELGTLGLPDETLVTVENAFGFRFTAATYAAHCCSGMA